jgi:ParB/RepB/Spo0J family partition protein
MSTKNAKLEVISVDKISISTTNPRKSIELKALKELSESIKEHGILQPILVRPYIDEKSTWETDYQLVCGERRYRAALEAGLEEVPCNIRVLTDEEAFELQIIENLERKDVHPLDEADAFKRMLDSGKYSMFDIAAKMAKTESFIAQRLKLVDLIDEVRADFLAGHLGIGHAILIARCDAIKQMDIYKDSKPWHQNGHSDYGTLYQLKEAIESDSYLISEAKFDTEDAELVKGCGACSVCPKRSGVNPVLFEDMAEDRCFDEKCFDEKAEAHLIKEVARIINNGEDIVLVAGWGSTNEMVVQMSKQFNVPIFAPNDFIEYNNEEVSDNESKAFYVNSHKAGTYVRVIINQKAKEKTQSASLPAPASGKEQSNEEQELRAEYAKLEQRQKRALELDEEKVWEAIRGIDTKTIKQNTDALFLTETNALCFAMLSKMGWNANRELMQLLDTKFDVDFAREKIFPVEIQNLITRAFVLEVLPDAFGTIQSSANHTAYEMVIKEYFPSEVDSIKNQQEIIADKRIASAEKKKAEILAKIEKLKPAEEIETKAEEVKPKKAKATKK